MFTGLVECLGTVQQVVDHPGGKDLFIGADLAPIPTIGESIAVNGACLTVAATDGNIIHFQIGPETLLKTNLGKLVASDRVNLERSLRVGDRLGGHFVQGHVDAIGTIGACAKQGEWEIVRFDCPNELTALMVPKGSIAVDGISLTLVEVGADFFTVMLIPHTLANTTLGFKKTGDVVNIETDMLARHVAKLIGHSVE